MGYKVTSDGTSRGTVVIDTDTGKAVENVTRVEIDIQPGRVLAKVVVLAEVGEVSALFETKYMTSRDKGFPSKEFLNGK